MSATPEKLEEHRLLQEQLADVKEREMKLRLEIVSGLTSSDDDPGTHNFYQDGFKIKIKLGLNYSFDNDELQRLIDDDLLTEEELDLLRIKYELKLADYKKADDTETLDDVIIVKPAAPTLTIELGE